MAPMRRGQCGGAARCPRLRTRAHTGKFAWEKGEALGRARCGSASPYRHPDRPTSTCGGPLGDLTGKRFRRTVRPTKASNRVDAILGENGTLKDMLRSGKSVSSYKTVGTVFTDGVDFSVGLTVSLQENAWAQESTLMSSALGAVRLQALQSDGQTRRPLVIRVFPRVLRGAVRAFPCRAAGGEGVHGEACQGRRAVLHRDPDLGNNQKVSRGGGGEDGRVKRDAQQGRNRGAWELRDEAARPTGGRRSRASSGPASQTEPSGNPRRAVPGCDFANLSGTGRVATISPTDGWTTARPELSALEFQRFGL